ncbi:hypothetical protein BGX26_001060 [Mortierella sp. AD094]|nr:hypothetical protein BGX26_001060 [Mortierella sp. AD094]
METDQVVVAVTALADSRGEELSIPIAEPPVQLSLKVVLRHLPPLLGIANSGASSMALIDAGAQLLSSRSGDDAEVDSGISTDSESIAESD